MRQLILFLLTAALVTPGYAQSRPQTPKPGSAERKAVLDALRKPVEEELEQSVRFKVDALRLLGDWAFVRGVPQRPDGKPVDYRRTRYQEAIDEGMFDEGLAALLKRSGDEWSVVVVTIGSTDVPWVTWSDDYSAPPELFE